MIPNRHVQIGYHVLSGQSPNPLNYRDKDPGDLLVKVLKQPDTGITIILLNNTGEFPRFEMSELMLNELNK